MLWSPAFCNETTQRGADCREETGHLVTHRVLSNTPRADQTQGNICSCSSFCRCGRRCCLHSSVTMLTQGLSDSGVPSCQRETRNPSSASKIACAILEPGRPRPDSRSGHGGRREGRRREGRHHPPPGGGLRTPREPGPGAGRAAGQGRAPSCPPRAGHGRGRPEGNGAAHGAPGGALAWHRGGHRRHPSGRRCAEGRKRLGTPSGPAVPSTVPTSPRGQRRLRLAAGTNGRIGCRRLLAESADGQPRQPVRAAGAAPPPGSGRAGRCGVPGGAMAGGAAPPAALLRAINALLLQRRYHAALAVLKGFRNGAVYGAKIRAPHALVMTFLFRSGSLREKLKSIAQATYTHSRNLAYFVFTYKGLMALQSRLQGKKMPFHSFFAACIGGWLVFGENNPINSQIIMYLLSRILFGLSRLAVEKGYIPQPKQDPFPLVAALVWGTVLWLFEYHRQTLQPSLQASMTYLYDDSNVWHDISDFLIYNKKPESK